MANWTKGRVRHQHLAGVRPNHNQQQWNQLRRDFAIRIAPHMARFKRVLVGVWPGTLAVYQGLYPDLMEQGVEFFESRLHQSEWKSFGYRAMLGGLGGKERTLYQQFLDHVVVKLGEEAHPGQVLKLFDESGLGGGSRAAVRAALALMVELTSEHEHYGALVREEGGVVLNYLEGESMGPDLMLPLQMVQMNVLEAARPPETLLMLILEEASKAAKNPVVAQKLEEGVGEQRHDLVMRYVGLLTVDDVSPKTVALASCVAQFGGVNRAHYERLQGLRPQFAGVRYGEVTRQPPGVARFGVCESNYPECAQEALEVHLRPSCVQDGGQTRTVGDGDWAQEEDDDE